jgi:hypothetical protein
MTAETATRQPLAGMVAGSAVCRSLAGVAGAVVCRPLTEAGRP